MGINCNGFGIKLVKIAQEFDLATWLVTGSGLQHPWKTMWGAHEEVQQSVCFASHLRLGQPARYTDQQDFKCDFYTLHP